MFKHALVRDAAYENLLKTRRQAIHVKLVEALAAKDAAPELLAHHASMAGMNEQACRYWLMAGERAAARSANKEAISHLKAGTNLIRGMPDTKEKLRLELDLHSALVPPLMAIHGYSSEAAGHVSSSCRGFVPPDRRSGRARRGALASVAVQLHAGKSCRGNRDRARDRGTDAR